MRNRAWGDWASPANGMLPRCPALRHDGAFGKSTSLPTARAQRRARTCSCWRQELSARAQLFARASLEMLLYHNRWSCSNIDLFYTVIKKFNSIKIKLRNKIIRICGTIYRYPIKLLKSLVSSVSILKYIFYCCWIKMYPHTIHTHRVHTHVDNAHTLDT